MIDLSVRILSFHMQANVSAWYDPPFFSTVS